MIDIDAEQKAFEAHLASRGIKAERDFQYTETYAVPAIRFAYHTWLARAEAEGWRPIATREKVSKHVMLFGDGPAIQECVVVGGWDELEQCWRLVGGGWFKPTHWRPLPAPPKEDGE